MKRQRWVWILIGILSSVLIVLAACKPGTPTVSFVPAATPSAGTTWWNDRVFYEVFVRSFQDSGGDTAGDGIGDLQGLIERLDYLNDGDPQTTTDLGVTGLWLMPVMESPSYHGYDVIDYERVEKDYGDNETFKKLMAEAHKRGMVVIIDLVINHTSSQHPWFQDPARRDWYVWSAERPNYQGPWGQGVWYKRGDAYYYAIFWEGMPDLNYRNQAVTDEVYQITQFWLSDMGADGLRMDAIRHLIEDEAKQENTPETHEWLRQYHSFYKNVNPKAMAVGEVWTNTENVVPYVGQELDICFEFDLASSIINAARGGSPYLLSSVVEKIVRLYPPNQYATFLSNHDQERVMTQLNENVGQAKIAAAIYLTLPGVPFIYYGEEIGMTGRKPDENLRTPMQWSGETAAGFTTTTPWYPINRDWEQKNVAAQQADPNSLLNHYKRLILLRSAYPALRTGSITLVQSEARSVFAYIRHSDQQDILVIHNMGQEAVQDYGLSARASPIKAGSYTPFDMLHQNPAAKLTVQEQGAFGKYLPWPQLEPLTSYVLIIK